MCTQETKTQLIIQSTEFTIKLKQLEDELLFKLSTAEGDITEDVALIESLEVRPGGYGSNCSGTTLLLRSTFKLCLQKLSSPAIALLVLWLLQGGTAARPQHISQSQPGGLKQQQLPFTIGLVPAVLQESKRVATDISEKVAEATETEAAINESRNRYRAVAARGAMLFFLLNSLNKIHAFYQFSLTAFVSVLSRGLDLAPGGKKRKTIAPAAPPAEPVAAAAEADMSAEVCHTCISMALQACIHWNMKLAAAVSKPYMWSIMCVCAAAPSSA
jgi:hypothetical protein